MKRNFIFVFAVLCGTLLPPFTASGQTYFDFALAELTGSSSLSIIRTVTPTEAIAYFETARQNKLVLVDMSLNVREIKLPQSMYVRDIRVCGTDIYFCGSMMTSSQMNYNSGFIAHVSYNDFFSSHVALAHDVFMSTEVSIFTRLVAYHEPATTMDKIVAVGDYVYPATGSNCYGLTSFGGTLCSRLVVMECDYDAGPQQFINHVVRYSNDANHLEYVSEVIETDNYVAVVGYDMAESAISVHPCPKGASILSSFDTYYYYQGTADDGQSLFHGCSMRLDTIAISSLALKTPTPVHLFETRVRVIDLASKTMTTSQAVYLDNDKAEPSELVYMPNYQKLVMLMYFQFIPNQYNYTFLHLKPYENPVPYFAKGIYESASTLPYYSVDRLTPTHYISTGGDYWFMKDVTIDAASTNCYKVDEVEAYKIESGQDVKKSHPYNSIYPNTSQPNIGLPVAVYAASAPCIHQRNLLPNKIDNNK